MFNFDDFLEFLAKHYIQMIFVGILIVSMTFFGGKTMAALDPIFQPENGKLIMKEKLEDPAYKDRLDNLKSKLDKYEQAKKDFKNGDGSGYDKARAISDEYNSLAQSDGRYKEIVKYSDQVPKEIVPFKHDEFNKKNK